MATDFNHHIKQQHLLDQIVDELYENAQRYAPFYQGTKKEMIKKANYILKMPPRYTQMKL